VTILAETVWTEIATTNLVLAIPLGSTEQHGPHLPLSTDTDIASTLTARLAKSVPWVAVAPALAYGSSGEHQAFAGTLSIGERAVELVVIELVRSAMNTFSRVVLVSAHGGNDRAVARAVRRLREEGNDVRAWSPSIVWNGDAHAGFLETSVMLALNAARVRTDAATAGDTRPIEELIEVLRSDGVAAVSANGVLGDPTGASTEAGLALLAEASASLIAAVRVWPESDKAWL
jgi:mycofactocin system creatininase family protein